MSILAPCPLNVAHGPKARTGCRKSRKDARNDNTRRGFTRVCVYAAAPMLHSRLFSECAVMRHGTPSPPCKAPCSCLPRFPHSWDIGSRWQRRTGPLPVSPQLERWPHLPASGVRLLACECWRVCAGGGSKRIVWAGWWS
eukprot:scaffold61285_cov30-Tisochrysis_lutea.AAC.2